MPSTHVTLTLVMAITLAMRKQRWASAVVVVLAVTFAWDRVYVGIHWPADMVGAALSALISVAVIYATEYVVNALVMRCKESGLAQHRQEPDADSNVAHSPATQPTER